MRKLLLIVVVSSGFICAKAQNPFAEYGYTPKIATLSNGQYNEFFDNDTIVQIGSVLYNTRSRKIASFIDSDISGSEETVQPDVVSRWMSPDPLQEQYPSWSPYNFVKNNPIKYIDPDGREVFITGALSNEALRQLQAKVGNSITLSMDDKGKVIYLANTDKRLRGDAKRMAGIINDNSITVNLLTTNKNETSTGNLMIGGSFMGNTVTTSTDGNTKVVANQEVNPTVLGTADSHTKTPGKMIMHEATEAYAGGQISQKIGVGVGPATQADVDNPSSVYNRAHNKATSQSTIYQTFYDKNGMKTTDVTQAVRAEWSVTKWFKSKVIQTLP